MLRFSVGIQQRSAHALTKKESDFQDKGNDRALVGEELGTPIL